MTTGNARAGTRIRAKRFGRIVAFPFENRAAEFGSAPPGGEAVTPRDRCGSVTNGSSSGEPFIVPATRGAVGGFRAMDADVLFLGHFPSAASIETRILAIGSACLRRVCRFTSPKREVPGQSAGTRSRLLRGCRSTPAPTEVFGTHAGGGRRRNPTREAVGHDRLELSANGLRVRCSTN
jgi:hypothetical protein